MTIRTWYVTSALASYASLNAVVNELTHEEVLHCLHLEAGTLRRRSVTNRLIQRAVRLHSDDYNQQLKKAFHATS